MTRSAHGHVANGFANLLKGGKRDAVEMMRQFSLVNHHEAIGRINPYRSVRKAVDVHRVPEPHKKENDFNRQIQLPHPAPGVKALPARADAQAAECRLMLWLRSFRAGVPALHEIMSGDRQFRRKRV